MDSQVSWLDTEGQEIRGELQRLKRRAMKRPLLVFLLCGLGASLVLFKLSLRVPMYQATIAMRATEGAMLEEQPLAARGLAHYLYTVALSSAQLLPIIEKHNLYPGYRNAGELAQVEQLRNWLDIAVSSNTFAYARDDGDPRRSVAIQLHFSDRDPQRAFAVAQDLGSALVAAEKQRRRDSAAKLRTVANSVVESVEVRLAGLQQKLAEATVLLENEELRSGNPLAAAEAQVTAHRLLADISDTQKILSEVSGARDNSNLLMSAESANEGLRFEVLEVRRPVVQSKIGLVAYILIGVFVFLCLIPLSAIGVAALDTRIHHIEDLIRIGLPVVGHVPSFRGSRMGSLRARQKRERRRS